MGLLVELFAAIRRDARVDEMSIRELARRHGVHRRTVRQALGAAEPPPRKRPAPSRPAMAVGTATAEASVRNSPACQAAQSGWYISATSWLEKLMVIDTLHMVRCCDHR